MENTNYEFFRQTFKEMFEIEQSMDNTYAQLILNVKNEKIKKILEHIRNDEINHEKRVQEILQILK